jgi:hypothetical protein
MLPFRGVHVKLAVQRGILASTQHLLWDQGKPRKTLIELAGRRTFQMQTVRVRVRVTLQLTVSQSVCLGVEPNLGLLTRDIFF